MHHRHGRSVWASVSYASKVINMAIKQSQTCVNPACSFDRRTWRHVLNPLRREEEQDRESFVQVIFTHNSLFPVGYGIRLSAEYQIHVESHTILLDSSWMMLSSPNCLIPNWSKYPTMRVVPKPNTHSSVPADQSPVCQPTRVSSQSGLVW